MKTNSFFIVSFLFFVVFSCTSQSNHVIESKDDSQYMIFQENGKTKTETLFLQSSFFKGIKTILLETNASSLIGLISKIRVNDQYIFILDAVHAKSLFVFNKEGQFIRKIGNVGQGPGEYNRPYDFTIDKDNKIIYILDGALQRINKYDIVTGTFIHAINLSEEVKSNRIEFLDGKLYADAYFRKHSNNNYLLRAINESSGKEENHYLNVMKFNKGVSNNTAFTMPLETFFLRENGNLIFVQQFMDHIIEINNERIFSLIDLKGKESLTSSEIKGAVEKNANIYAGANLLPELRQLKKYVDVNSFIEHKNWILLEYNKGIRPIKFLIDKKTNEVTIFENKRDDLLVSDETVISYPVPQVGCYDAGGVYCIIHFTGVKRIKELAKAGDLSLGLDRLEDLINLEEDANPILFYYEFKE